jgi:hypothetical protein
MPERWSTTEREPAEDAGTDAQCSQTQGDGSEAEVCRTGKAGLALGAATPICKMGNLFAPDPTGDDTGPSPTELVASRRGALPGVPMITK